MSDCRKIFLCALCAFLCVFAIKLSAQSRTIDSLKTILRTAKHDTTRAQIYIALGMDHFNSNMDSGLFYWEKSLKLCEINSEKTSPERQDYFAYKRILGNALNNIAFYHKQNNRPEKAEEYYRKSLKTFEEIKYVPGITKELTKLGLLFTDIGQLNKAIDNYTACLAIQTKNKDEKGASTSLNNMANLYADFGDLDKALEYYLKSLRKKELVNDSVGIPGCLHNIASVYNERGNNTKALEYYNIALKRLESLGDKGRVAATLNDVGLIYQNYGDIPKALQYFVKALKMAEEAGQINTVVFILNNIAGIHHAQGDPQQAIKDYERCLTLQDPSANATGRSLTLNNLGTVYKDMKQFNKALGHYNEALKLLETIGDRQKMATVISNIGVIYQIKGVAEGNSAFAKLALENYSRSLNIYEEVKSSKGIAYGTNNVGSAYLNLKNFAKALEYFSRSMKLSAELGYPENIRNVAKNLHELYQKTGNYERALENYELYIKMNDSISNETTRKASIKSQLKYEYEKQAAADSVAHAKESEIKNAELAKQKAEISAKKNQQYALFGGLGLVMIFAGFMYNRFTVTQKQKGIIEEQKNIVEEQKHLVEEKQKEILDSIHYAKRIQLAQIPTEKRVSQILNRLKGHEGK